MQSAPPTLYHPPPFFSQRIWAIHKNDFFDNKIGEIHRKAEDLQHCNLIFCQ